MSDSSGLTRYSVIHKKNPREIVLLRASGCKWRRCTFCDYHLDFSPDTAANYALNQAVLENVSGIYGKLEVINSGSIVDLDADTLARIRDVCREKHIDELHAECHYMHRGELPALRSFFAQADIRLKVKLGVETFDADYRERVLDKGIPVSDPARIAEGFDEVCLLFGLPGQTAASMILDIATGLLHFERVCVNLMTENSTPVKPDAGVRADFLQNVFPLYRDDPRVDILLENTDFGVG